MTAAQFEKIRTGRGFLAALDQSGGSTPKALAHYGVPEDSYSGDTEMFDAVHAMRTRIITDPGVHRRAHPRRDPVRGHDGPPGRGP